MSGGSRIAQVRLDGADVMLETDGAGQSNWALVAQASPVAGTSAVGALQALGVIGALFVLIVGKTLAARRPSAA